MTSTEEAISAYYSSLSADEEKETRAWGDFAAEQLRRESRGNTRPSEGLATLLDPTHAA